MCDEFFMAGVLLPCMQTDLASPSSVRVKHSDACETGIGRAWTTCPLALVEQMARLSDGRGAYPNLGLPRGIALGGPTKSAMKRLDWPWMPRHWRKVAARCTRSHIGLAEADAALWALEDRLLRPLEWICCVL